MKTLILIRHAKSSWDNPGLSDHDRPLNKRGERDAPRMAEFAARNIQKPDLLLSSTAVRAYTTAKHFASAYQIPISQIQNNREIYHASTSKLLKVVQQLPPDKSTVMLFGHNPGFTDFANALANTQILNIPTCGIVSIDFVSLQWIDLKPGGGKNKLFVFPKGIK